jgi:indole-3-glycerol phosphate synthase
VAKDFVVSPAQLVHARDAGADAVLLIAALYRREELLAWAAAVRGLGMVPLVETHDPADLEKLAGAEWELVGVNNRDLRTFAVDLGYSAQMAPRLPAGALRVAESGIGGRRDIDRLAAAGFDAFLVGESLLLAADPAEKLRELVEP